MNKEEFEWREAELKKIFVHYSIKVKNYYKLEMNDPALLDYLMKQIDTVLDWHNDLVKHKSN